MDASKTIERNTIKVMQPNTLLSRKPVIGVCGAAASKEGAGMTASQQAMIKKLTDAGAQVQFFPDKDGRDAVTDLADIDALVVLGDSMDIDPAEYGAAKHEKTIICDARAAVYRSALINGAMQMNLPLLGICAGMQRINILNHEQDGGTLIQHVPDVLGNNSHWNMEKASTPVLPISILEDSQLARIGYGLKTIYSPDHARVPGIDTETNAIHHQAVDKVREGFRISAISKDGIVMAIEPKPDGKYAGKPIMGVQWHPELLNNELSMHLINHLVDEARDYVIWNALKPKLPSLNEPIKPENEKGWADRIINEVARTMRYTSAAR